MKSLYSSNKLYSLLEISNLAKIDIQVRRIPNNTIHIKILMIEGISKIFLNPSAVYENLPIELYPVL